MKRAKKLKKKENRKKQGPNTIDILLTLLTVFVTCKQISIDGTGAESERHSPFGHRSQLLFCPTFSDCAWRTRNPAGVWTGGWGIFDYCGFQIPTHFFVLINNGEEGKAGSACPVDNRSCNPLPFYFFYIMDKKGKSFPDLDSNKTHCGGEYGLMARGR